MKIYDTRAAQKTARLQRARQSKFLLLVAGFALVFIAWGPHPDITKAALSVLGKNDAIVVILGAETERLSNYTWMPDWRRSLIFGGDCAFYPDDFLLFPGMRKFIGHICPEIKQTYEPYFLRALQALRTETAPNAARWIGSLGHFIEDTASPPHAFPTEGELHFKMENWIDGKAIQIKGHKPQSLGEDDESALKGFLARMDKLEAFARERGEKVKKLVEAGDRPAVEVLSLENADESARVLSDVLYTLGKLAGTGVKKGATLRGAIKSVQVDGLEKLPAKIMLTGTKFSTLAGADGHYEFRNIPAGDYKLLVVRPGNELYEQDVSLAEGKETVNDLVMKQSEPAGNMLRNGGFNLRWVNPSAPDCWYLVKQEWESDVLPVTPGKKMKLSVTWKEGAKGGVVLRWRNTVSPSGGQFKTEPVLEAGETARVVTVPEKMKYAKLLIQTKDDPAKICDRVALVNIE